MSGYRPCLLCGEMHEASGEYDASDEYYCPNVRGPNSEIALRILTDLRDSVADFGYGEGSKWGWHWTMVVPVNPPHARGKALSPRDALRQSIAVLTPYAGDQRAAYLADIVRNNLRAMSLRASQDKDAQKFAIEARDALDKLMGWPPGTSGKGYA